MTIERKPFQQGHLLNNGTLALPITPERNKKLSDAAKRRKAIESMPKITLGWSTK